MEEKIGDGDNDIWAERAMGMDRAGTKYEPGGIRR
jgi:hypothetical protein